uniref:RHS repeat domain-containing protein n=1 Tax=Pseudomonas ficuserectae TaxID=53410 RepID=UPI00138F0108|nr:RHS repeat domain-containing protein [Pseudomonas ficuserectae]
MCRVIRSGWVGARIYSFIYKPIYISCAGLFVKFIFRFPFIVWAKDVLWRSYVQLSIFGRVTLIKDEPSANCPASNSAYTYDERGLILTKTDAKGLVTTYSYQGRTVTQFKNTRANTNSRVSSGKWIPK